MTRTTERESRREKKKVRRSKNDRSSSTFTEDRTRVTSQSRIVTNNDSHHLPSRVSDLATESRSMADAKMKLNENRHRILVEMGIDDRNRSSLMTVSSDAEILRETVIEHKIQIPIKSLVKDTVMKEVEIDSVEMVSEDTYETEKVPTRIITIGRPSDVIQDVRIIEDIVEVPEIVVKKNFIEKKVPRIYERVVEVPDDNIHCVEKQYDLAQIEYVDNVVHLEEEYTQYVDIEVPEIVEIPNYIELTEEKHVTRDIITPVNHYQPKVVELENCVLYECPTLKPIYHDETYTLNVPRIIQVPVFEDLLPAGNLDTLYILKHRFDELSKMTDPVAMCFVEDYAVAAQETFHTTNFADGYHGVDHPTIQHTHCPIPSDEPSVRIPVGHNTHHDSSKKSNRSHHSNRVTSSSSSKSRSSSSVTFESPANQKQRKMRWCGSKKTSPNHLEVAKPTKVKHSSPSPQVHHQGPKRVPRQHSQATHMTGPTFTTGPSAMPSAMQYHGHSSNAGAHPQSHTSRQVTHHTQHSFDMKPKITETFVGTRVEKRSVDTNYVQQFVTNADPYLRHPPSHISVMHQGNNQGPTDVRRVTYNNAARSSMLPVHHQQSHEIGVVSRGVSINSHHSNSPHPTASIHSHSQRSSIHTPFDGGSLYCDGAAARPGGLPRVNKQGELLIHPPTPTSSI